MPVPRLRPLLRHSLGRRPLLLFPVGVLVAVLLVPSSATTLGRPGPVATIPMHPGTGTQIDQDELPAGSAHTVTPAALAVTAASAATADSGVSAVYGPRTGTGCSPTTSPDDRVQVVYLRSSDAPDRYNAVAASLQADLRTVDATFVASAVKTGGTRQVRWVTDAACQPAILNVVVPPWGTAADPHRVDNPSNADMQSALTDPTRNGGLTLNATNRKYLILLDPKPGIYAANGVFPSAGGVDPVCGNAIINLDAQPGPANASNFGPSYGRIDAQCWPGAADKDAGYQVGSAIAHELMHQLGSVLDEAPHSNGHLHCTDEADLMCYDDGSGSTLTHPCPDSQKWLFDCNNDDYFNTSRPSLVGTDPVTHAPVTYWNTASNLFLFQPGPPTVSLSPSGFVAGTPFTVTPTVTVPSGQGYRVRWSASAGCAVGTASAANGTPGALSTTVQCPADTPRSPTVTVTVDQEDGQSATATALLFDDGDPQSTALTLSPATASLTAGQSTTLTAHVTDPNTGLGVQGVPVAVTAHTASGDTVVTSATTGPTGDVSTPVTVAATTDYTAQTTAVGDWAAATADATVHVVVPTTLTVTTPSAYVASGAIVHITGRLTASGGGAGVAGEPVALWNSATSYAPFAITDATGNVSLDVTVTSGRTYQLRFAGDGDTQAATSAIVTLTLATPTALTGAVSRTVVTQGDPVTVTGTLTTGGGPLAGASVTLSRVSLGVASTVATATTTAAGAVTFTTTAAADGTYQLLYPAAGKYQGSYSPVLTVAARAAVTLTLAGAGTAAYGAPVTLTSTATATAGGTPLAVTTVELWRSAPGGVATRYALAATDAHGTARFTVTATGTYDYQARRSLDDSYGAGTSPVSRLTGQRTTALTASLNHTTAAYGTTVAVTATLTSTTKAAPGGVATEPVTLSASYNGAPARPVATGWTNGSGMVVFSQVATTRTVYQVAFAGTADATRSTAGAVSVAVTRATTAGLTLSHTSITAGQKLTVTGWVTAAGSSAKLAAQPVQLWHSAAGGAWAPDQHATAGSAGTAVFAVAPTVNTRYQIRYAGAAAAAVALGAATSGGPGVGVMLAFTLHTATSVDRGHSYTVTGTVSPATKGIKVWYVLGGADMATAVTDSHGAFHTTLDYRNASTGKQTVHLYTDATARNATSVSAKTTVTVH